MVAPYALVALGAAFLVALVAGFFVLGVTFLALEATLALGALVAVFFIVGFFVAGFFVAGFLGAAFLATGAAPSCREGNPFHCLKRRIRMYCCRTACGP